MSPRLNHSHHEEAFDDLSRQPLLPWRLSQLGPGVAWHDVDGDGWEDLIIGSGKGGMLAVYRNDRQGGFSRWTNAPLSKAVSRQGADLFQTRMYWDTNPSAAPTYPGATCGTR